MKSETDAPSPGRPAARVTLLAAVCAALSLAAARRTPLAAVCAALSLAAARRTLLAAVCAALSLAAAHGPVQAQSAASLESLAARVQVLEDREAIRALILAYGEAHDNRDYATFSKLFAKEGEWVGGLGSAKGPEAIFELMDGTIGHNPQPGGSGTYHVMTNDQIRIDGDRASSTTKWIYLTPGDDGAPRAVFLGHYDDEFVRENGEWRFLRREAPVDIPVQE